MREGSKGRKGDRGRTRQAEKKGGGEKQREVEKNEVRECENLADAKLKYRQQQLQQHQQQRKQEKLGEDGFEARNKVPVSKRVPGLDSNQRDRNREATPQKKSSRTLADKALSLASEAHADSRQRKGEDQAHHENVPGAFGSRSYLSAGKRGGKEGKRNMRGDTMQPSQQVMVGGCSFVRTKNWDKCVSVFSVPSMTTRTHAWVVGAVSCEAPGGRGKTPKVVHLSNANPGEEIIPGSGGWSNLQDIKRGVPPLCNDRPGRIKGSAKNSARDTHPCRCTTSGS